MIGGGGAVIRSRGLSGFWGGRLAVYG